MDIRINQAKGKLTIYILFFSYFFSSSIIIISLVEHFIKIQQKIVKTIIIHSRVPFLAALTHDHADKHQTCAIYFNLNE